MTNYIENQNIEAKLVTFEPGNCTRYTLVLAKVDAQTLIITDITNHKTYQINPKVFLNDLMAMAHRLHYQGMGGADAKEVAQEINNQLLNW